MAGAGPGWAGGPGQPSAAVRVRYGSLRHQQLLSVRPGRLAEHAPVQLHAPGRQTAQPPTTHLEPPFHVRQRRTRVHLCRHERAA